MKWKIAGALAGAIVLILFLVDGMFVVRPDQFAIVTEFGDPVTTISQTVCTAPEKLRGTPVSEVPEGACTKTRQAPAPGLYFKMPLTQDVRYLDARVRGWYDEAKDAVTVELRTIDFEAFARWRIIDPLRFYTAAREESRAMAGMDSIVTARVQYTVSENKLASIVRDRGRDFEDRAELDLRELIADYDVCSPNKNEAIKKVLREAEESNKQRGKRADDAQALRSELVNEIRDFSNTQLEAQFGIRILDLHFTKLNYSKKIFDQMVEAIKKDRERDIAAYEKVGKVCRGSIDQVKVRLKGQIDGEKEKEVRRIHGEAEAQAIKIKAAAFGQDPDFFRFIKTLELYESAIGDGTSLVLSTDSPLFKLMRSAEFEPTGIAPITTVPTPVPALRAPPAEPPSNP